MSETATFFAFNSLPLEIKLQVIRPLIQGWKATLERHEKPEQKKWTTRIWSSRVYDMLMLSLTCKEFHAIIQAIQYEPSLYSGELDMIEENGDLSYMFEDSLSKWNIQYGLPPCHAFRTQVFIKSSPYNKFQDPLWRTKRTQYHRGVRAWLLRNTCSLAVHLDELIDPVPWEAFPALRHLTLFCPRVQLDSENTDQCRLPPEHLAHMASRAKAVLHPYISSSTKLSNVLAEALKRGMTLTAIWSLSDLHESAHIPVINAGGWESSCMEITCSVDADGWRLLSCTCS